MLISTRKKFLFYHVYKVAGSSVRAALKPYCNKTQFLLQNTHYIASTMGVNLNVAPINTFHPKLHDVKQYMGESFDQYYKFSFVRHPLDWQKSLFFFMKKNKRHHQHEIVSKFNFEDYIKWRLDSDFKLMSDLLYDENNKLLVDDIYKFENIDSEFHKLCKVLEITATLPHKNIAGLGKKVELTDATLIEFKTAFHKDFLFFDYL